MNGKVHDLTADLQIWTDEDLIKYAKDTELMLGLEKYQVVKVAEELAWRFSEEGATNNGLEYNG